MVSEIHRAKILVKIDELKKEKFALNQRLEKEKSFNIVAWKEYGSELCSAEMDANETAIVKKIADVIEKINILEYYLVGGAFSTFGRSQLRELIADHKKAIESTELVKLRMQESLDKFILLDELLMQSGIK